MSLKQWTTGVMVLGLGLLFGFPVLVMNRPEGNANPHGQRLWLLEFGGYIVLTTLVWSVVAVMALLVIKQVRRCVAEERERNMEMLMEMSLRDHASNVTVSQSDNSGHSV